MIFSSISLICIFQFFGSASIKIGVAPELMTAETQEIIVKVGMMTSSPSLIPNAFTAISNAAVPLETATPYFLFTLREKLFSNFSTKGPSDEIHPVSNASRIYFFSLLPITG